MYKKIMKYLSTTLSYMKENKKEILFIKIMVLAIVNTWLLIIFWKILLIENVNVIGTNVALTKMQTAMQPVLMYLGLDILTPSMIKMLIVTMIIITVNLMILNFNGMLGLIVSLGIARYGYKMYTNYLINSENMMLNNQVLQTPKQIIKEKAIEQVPIVINTGGSTGTNWWLWGTVIVIGVIAIGGIALTIWSHNTNANNVVETNEASLNLIRSINNRIDLTNQNLKVLQDQIELNSKTTRDYVVNINEHFTAVESKIDNNFTAVEMLKDNYAQVTKLSNSNTLELSQKSVNLSEKAVGIMQEMSEISSATEGVTIALAKFYDIINNQNERLTLVETRMDTISGVATPRTVNMTFNPIKKPNEL